jgi:hypothetical protein
MRWKYSQEDLVLIAEIDKIHGKVESMAVNDKKLLSSSCFLFCMPVKHVFYPSKAKGIICSS